MNKVNRALWYIENNIGQPITLEKLAEIAGVSRYHLSRIFCYAVGTPASRYLRLRRLTHAAIALAAGEPDILSLALTLGYSSHEAFSRAFKDEFGETPEQIRQRGNTNNLNLTGAHQMPIESASKLSEPNQRTMNECRIMGYSQHYDFENMGSIPNQWQRFAEQLPFVAKEPHPVAFGVIFNSSDTGFDYLSGAIPTRHDVEEHKYVTLKLPKQNYLVFDHAGHVSAIRETCAAIWSEWLPAAGINAVEAPWFERYGESFDPISGNGGLEVWIPIE